MRAGFLLFLLAGCQTTAEFQERRLTTLPADLEVLEPILFSRDGTEVAYRAKEVDGWRAVRGSWTSGRLDFL